MKVMFASDIHGSACCCQKLLEAFDASGAGRLVLLGDILYHGPRNDLPAGYDPKEVIRMLNGCRDKIYGVRGNCDTEVDQMVLEFPIMADYGLLEFGGKVFYATHGHLFHQDTHLLKAEYFQAEGIGRIGIVNPGSVSIPKGGNPATYGMLEDGVFRIFSFNGDVVKELAL